MFVQEHLEAFRSFYLTPPTLSGVGLGEGKAPKPWFGRVDPSPSKLAHDLLDDTPVNRTHLLNMQSSPMPTAQFCVSIFAWGGMRTSNGKHLFGLHMKPWLDVAQQLRDGALSRVKGYDAFVALRNTKSLAGLGPAYFTKLLYFLPPPAQKGYIMDQWLGLSINLLTGQEIVKLNESITWEWKPKQVSPRFDSLVSDFNDGAGYEMFCNKIERLSVKMGFGWTPELTELALISEGGHVKKGWRDYVVKKRQARLLST
jgi:hypothetical protein